MHALHMSVGEQFEGFAEVRRVTEDLSVKGSRKAIRCATPG